jgi:hypothetical protein
VKPGDTLPGDQAEIVFADRFVEYLAELTINQAEDVLVNIVGLCRNPLGSHRLGNSQRDGKLTGWNTLYVLGGEHRVVFAAKIVNGVGVIEVLCGGPRRANAVYDLAADLVEAGHLTDEETTELWEAIALLEIVAEKLGLDGWDFLPEPAPGGMVRAVVAAKLLDEDVAKVLSKAELEAAMAEGWGSFGPGPAAALIAALRRARVDQEPGDLSRIVKQRGDDRCDAVLSRAGRLCVRRSGHPGPHRGTR